MKNEREKDLQELFTTYYPALKSFCERLVGWKTYEVIKPNLVFGFVNIISVVEW